MKVKIGYWYHEAWRRYHSLKWSKHRDKASRHLGRRGRLTTDAVGNPARVRKGS